MYLFLVLSLFVPLTICIMMATQYRRFWPTPFVSKEDFVKYLASPDKLMCTTNVQESNRVFYLELSDYTSVLSLPDAIKLLLVKDSHTLIIYYYTASQMEKGMRMYANHNATPQIWSYFNLAQGPGGERVMTKEIRQVVNMRFTGNSILAVGWTFPADNYSSYKEMMYNESHILNMSASLGFDKPNNNLVIVFDALLLANTPEVVEWLPSNLDMLPVMIVLGDPKLESSVKVDNLRNFVKTTKMWPIFFDLPKDIQQQLIAEDPKFTTIDYFGGRNGEEERGLGSFRIVVAVMGLLCMWVWVRLV